MKIFIIIFLSVAAILWGLGVFGYFVLMSKDEKEKVKKDTRKQCYPVKPHKNHYSCFPLSLWNQN